MKKAKTLLTIALICLSTNATATGSRKGDPAAESQSFYSYITSFFYSGPEAPSSEKNE